MNKQKLKKMFFQKTGLSKLPLIFDTVLDEACDEVSRMDESEKELYSHLIIRYWISLKLLSSFIKGIIEREKATQVTLNYRNKKFIIKSSDPFLKCIR